MKFIHGLVRYLAMLLLALNLFSTLASLVTLDSTLDYIAVGITLVWMAASLSLILTSDGQEFSSKSFANYKGMTVLTLAVNAVVSLVISGGNAELLTMLFAPFAILTTVSFIAVRGRFNYINHY
ncbi:hypothetical protein [Vibrio splendidus]|uniref:hypothetical protein n=1 Tax=Vibrio splendidus TaxID=29497 RepID=UPI000C82C888|nr:hypothetical protein [Vibrio splendidus]PMH03394.1 hypothetical protein BCU75_23695 [Vibrio splendidus]